RGHVISQDAWPLVALASEELPQEGETLWTRVRVRLSEIAKLSPSLVRVLGQLDCVAAAALDRQKGALAEVRGCGLGQVPEGERLRWGLIQLERSPLFPKVTRALSLLGLLGRPEAPVRVAAARALGTLGDKQAVPPLRTLLSGDDLSLAVVA